MNEPLQDIFVLLAAYEDKKNGDLYVSLRGDGAALRRLERRKLVKRMKGTYWRVTPYGVRWLRSFANILRDKEWWRNPTAYYRPLPLEIPEC